MTQRDLSNKPFDAMGRDELEQYARNLNVQGTDSMSDTELRKRLLDADTTTGVAPEGPGPVVHKGDPGGGPEHGR